MTKFLYKCVFCLREEIRYELTDEPPYPVPRGFIPLIPGACGQCVAAGRLTSMKELETLCDALGERLTMRN